MNIKWFQIVQNYPTKFGLTIPFILGALRQPVGQVLPSDVSLEELRAFLVSLRDDAPNPYNVIIRGCTDLSEPIVTLSNTAPTGFLRFDSPSKQECTLYFQSFYGLVIYDGDFESLVESLWKRYEQIISEGQFSSLGDNKWEAFGESDLTKLKSYCNIE